jgi:UDPglucose--hexose-1-phosphate uridylyltransferase
LISFLIDLFPYMMCIHQAPVNSPEWNDCEQYYRFHVEFYPPLRAKDKIKWYAGSEMGAGAAANPLDVDDMRASLSKTKWMEMTRTYFAPR